MPKRIRDLLYGYIELDEPQLSLIDAGVFQRLKRVRQLTSQNVFPSTNHTRFEHSLGVLALGRRAYEAIQRNSAQDIAKVVAAYRPTLEAALLLHDVGHAPLSHLGERFYVTSEIIGKLADCGVALTSRCAAHEAMSAFVCASHLSPQLKGMGVDVEFLCRMITGQPYSGDDWPKDALIGLVNSWCDVDKLDYVVRDNFMTGGHLASFDHERISSAYLVNQRTLAFGPESLSAIANMVHGRNRMYQWVYNHHTTVYTDNRALEYLNHLVAIGALKPSEVFSPEAITDSLADDSDALAKMKEYRHSDSRSEALFSQVFERRQHTCLWKTWYEFRDLFADDLPNRARLQGLGSDPGVLGQKVREKAGLDDPDVLYAAKAVYKPFTPIASQDIYIATGSGNKPFTEFFETKVTTDLPGEMPYVFFDANAIERSDVIGALKAL